MYTYTPPRGKSQQTAELEAKRVCPQPEHHLKSQQSHCKEGVPAGTPIFSHIQKQPNYSKTHTKVQGCGCARSRAHVFSIQTAYQEHEPTYTCGFDAYTCIHIYIYMI